MPSKIYFIGIAVSAFGILTAVWLSAVTARRTETRELIKSFANQSEHLHDLIYEGWLDEGTFGTDVRNCLARINLVYTRYRMICGELNSRLPKVRISDDELMELQDIAANNIEDRLGMPREVRRQAYIKSSSKLSMFVYRFEREHNKKWHKFVWW